jgi:hypothetical protein
VGRRGRDLGALARLHDDLQRAGRVVEHQAGDRQVTGQEGRRADVLHRHRGASPGIRDGAGPGPQILGSEGLASHAASPERIDEPRRVEGGHAAPGVAEHDDVAHAEHVDGQRQGTQGGPVRLEGGARRAEQERVPVGEAQRFRDQGVEPGVVAGDDGERKGFDRRERPRLAAAHERPVVLEDAIELHDAPPRFAPIV